jgi:predicted phosphoribosyltransferase
VKGYRDRTHAGDVLAQALSEYRDQPDVIVLGLVRGGVPVAARVAARLGAPLDVLVVRKLGVPQQPELAFGALGPGGVRVLNPEVAGWLDEDEVARVSAAEAEELDRRERWYRAGRAPLALAGRTAILVDDGLATGATAAAAVTVARQLGADRVVLAVPVGPPDAVIRLAHVADEVCCPLMPPRFGAVSRYYQSFPQVASDEIAELLDGGSTNT